MRNTVEGAHFEPPARGAHPSRGRSGTSESLVENIRPALDWGRTGGVKNQLQQE